MATLDDFFAEIGRSGVKASEACEEYANLRLRKLCKVEKDDDGNEVLIPNKSVIRLAGGDVELAMMQLMSRTRLDVETLGVSFKTTIDLGEDGSTELAGHVGLLKNSIEIDANITFKAHDSTEALELLRERADRSLSQALSRTPKTPKTPKETEV